MSTGAVGLDELLGAGLSAKSAYLYARILIRADAELGAGRGVDLRTCTAPDVAWLAARWRQSHSARAQLRAALAKQWELSGRPDPPALRAVRVPPKPKGRCRALSPDAAARLERHAWERADLPGLAVLLGLYAALRRAEIASLRWENVVGDETGRPVWLRVWGKGDLAADVPVHPVLAQALAWHRRPLGWVFPGRAGGAAGPSTIWAWVGIVSAGAGLAPVPTHVLRHTALAEANDRSGDLRAVQEIARHARPETTAGYTRVSGQRLLHVVAMIDYGRAVAS